MLNILDRSTKFKASLEITGPLKKPQAIILWSRAPAPTIKP